MRKSYFAIIALGALVIASCQKENSAVLPKVDSPVFTATLDTDSDTKTELVERDGKKKSEWVSKDSILVLNGTNTTGCAAKYTTTDSGASATFKTDVKGFTGDAFIAMYPASQAKYAWWNASDGKTVKKLWLKPVQTAVDGGYDPDAHVAVTYTDTKTLDFSNAVSLLKFTCGSDNISEVCVRAIDAATVGAGTESKNVLSGNFNFNTEPEKKEVITEDKVYTYNSVKVTGDNETLKKGQTYYIACLPTTFTQGFTVEVKSNGIKGDNKTTTKYYKLNRNTILNLGSVEYKKTLYLNTNGIWNKDGAWFAAYFFNDSDEKTWARMEQVGETGYYKVVAPDVTKYTKVIFCRMKPDSDALTFDNKWNQTGDLTIGDENCYTITGWDSKDGSWTVK